MRTLKLLVVMIATIVMVAPTGVPAVANNGDGPWLESCFETPGIHPMTANRPGYTYRSFTDLRSGCVACDEACHADEACIAWTCFHPTHFGAGGILPGPRPIACHLKSELPIPSPDPCAPPPREPTSGNGVHDDRCYTSVQAPPTLPRRPERERGVLSTISIADPQLAQSINGELLVEANLIDQIYDDLAEQQLGGLFDDPLPECSRVRADGDASKAEHDAPAIGPGLVTGAEAHEAFEALREGNLVAFTDFEKVKRGPHTKIKLNGPDGAITVKMRTTAFRYPLPPKGAPKNTPVLVLPYGFVSEPANRRLMGSNPGNIPDGQAQYRLVLSEPVSHAGLLRMWNTYSLTRFYNEAGTLLAEHRNTENHEFVGYVADGPENRVKTIEFDGVREQPKSKSNKLFQVGSVDDLYLGTVPTR